MNRLNPERKKLVLDLLTECNSIRGIQRLTGVHQETTIRLIREVGANCQREMNYRLYSLRCKYIACDELWTYVGKKKKMLKPGDDRSQLADQFVWVAFAQESRLVICHAVGKRTSRMAVSFLQDLRNRVEGRFQLSTDQYSGYRWAVDKVFGTEIDYAIIRKSYVADEPRREGYRPRTLRGVFIREMVGNPKRYKISTSLVERQNLTVRTQCRRFTRLTNAFSKKLDCLKAAVAIHYWHYNFMRFHGTIRCTPAMEQGIADSFSTWDEVLN